MKHNHRGIRFRLFGAALLALTAALPLRADYQSTVLSQGPVGYWRLNETTQPPANSSAANLGSLGAGAAGAYLSSPTHELAGPFTGSLAAGLDGVGQAINTPWSAGLNTTNFTFEIWANPDVAPYFAYLASSVQVASPRSGWYLAQDSGGTFGLGSAWVVRMFAQSGTAQSITLSAPVTGAGTWVHLVLTYDATANVATLYTNGAVASSGSPTGNKYVPNVSQPFTVGCRSSLNFFWPGKVAETAMYGSALSASQVAAHYTAATTAPGSYAATVSADAPLLYQRYREASDVFAANLGTLGAAANAKYQFGTTPGVAAPRPATYPGFEAGNNAVAVHATGASVSVPALNIDTNTVTISGWINASNAQNAAAGIIVCDAATTYSGLTIDVPFGGLGLGYVWNNEPSSYNWSPSVDAGLPPLPDSEWAYVALVVRPTSASIYLATTNNAGSFTGVTNFLNHVNQKFNGATLFGSDGGAAAYSFKGAIDEVAIFNRSLGVGELYSQYAAAIGGLAPKIFTDPQPPVDGVYAGDTLLLNVDAGGTPDLTFQWYNTGGAISGATSAVYSKPNVLTTDSDGYYVIITNSQGSVTSAVASVTVNSAFAPAIVTPPLGRTLYPGATLNLNVVATGGGLKYQWKKGGTDISGATASAYQISSVTTNNSGSYSVIVSNNVNTASAGPVVVNVVAPANGYETAIVADAPEAWYRLNETSGTNLFDSMGRHDGTYTNVSGSPVTFGAAGAIVGSADTAVTFDGTSVSYGIVPFSTKLNGAKFAIEAWVKTSDTANTICPVSSRSAVPQGYWLYTVPAGSWSGGVSQSGNNYYVPSATAGDAIVPGEWKHVVMTYDTSLRVFVNGQWDGQGYVDFERNAGAPFIIGARGPALDYLYSGQVDEILVYTNALTLAQAQNHYSKAKFPNPIPPYFLVQPGSDQVVSNASATVTLSGSADGPIPITFQWYKNNVLIPLATNASLSLSATYSNAGSYVLRATNPNGFTNSAPATLAVLPPNPPFVNVTNGLVLHLTFDGNYSDSSGRGNNATAVGAPSIVAGRLGSGVFLSTSNSTPEVNYLTLGKPADLNFGSSVDFSVAYWVKYEAGQTNGDLPFLCSAVNSYGNPGITFAPSYKQGGWSFSLNGTVQTYGSPNSINDGNWHHLVHTFSRTGNGVTYLDGGQVDSRLANGAGNLDTGNDFNIGQDPSGAYPEDGSVTLDDMAVWRRALTAYEAYSLYYAATNGNTSFTVPGPVALNISSAGGNIVLSWQPGATLGTLLEADSPTGPWTPVPVYTPVYQVTPSAAQKFYRLGFSE